MSVEPKVAAQLEAEKTYNAFILWSKRITAWSAFFLLLAVVGCNSGVDGTGSSYNGEQYSPRNLNVQK